MNKRSEELGEAVFAIESLTNCVGQNIYNYGKAQIFNVLETALEPGERLRAAKRLVENILNTITNDVATILTDTLGQDWEMPVLYPVENELSPEEVTEARKAYDEVEKIIR